MTQSMNTQDQESIFQLIFSSIDEIGKKMEETPDLAQDVLPFMSPSFAKIKQLAMLKQADSTDYYELMQISTNYIPKVIHTYCAFPLEYRNKNIIKNNLTARQLLIEDLKILHKQINAVEKNMYSSFETQMKINSNLMKEKYSTGFQLQSEMDSNLNDNFINQFDINQYKENVDYKSIHFKKDEKNLEAERERIANQKAKKEAQAQMISKYATIAKNTSTSFFKSTSKFLRNLGILTLEIVESIWDNMGVGIVVISFFGLVAYGFISLISISERGPRLYTHSLSSMQKIHSVMSASQIPAEEMPRFIAKIKEETIDGSFYREENLSFKPLENGQGLIMQVTNFDQAYCARLIDWKEISFDYTSLKINGIPLPQDNILSNYNILQNENHNICHLKEGNEITATFSNKDILSKTLAEKQSSPAYKESKKIKYQEEIKTVNNMLEKTSKETRLWSSINEMKKELEDAVKKMEMKESN